MVSVSIIMSKSSVMSLDDIVRVFFYLMFYSIIFSWNLLKFDFSSKSCAIKLLLMKNELPYIDSLWPEVFALPGRTLFIPSWFSAGL